MFGDKSLFQLTTERNKHFADTTIIVGNKDNYLLSQADLARAGVHFYTEIIEATPRNTAAAIAFAAFEVLPEDILLVTPSDHIITNEEAYEKAIMESITLADQGFLVTFGITPSKPETGYGYIEHQKNEVVSFREKPDRPTAELFLEQGNFLWNSGMFCFKAKVFLEELRTYEPDIYATALETWQHKSNGFLPEVKTFLIPSKSIDYAVMERSSKIKVVRATFDWSDLGSFESIWEHWLQQGQAHRFKQNNCVVSSTKHVEFLGVSNLILVETEDAILVLDKSNSQEVRHIFDRLEKEKPALVK